MEHSGRLLVPNGIRGVEGLHCSRVGGRPRGRIRDDAVPFVPNRRLGPRARRRRHDVHLAPAYGHPAARPGVPARGLAAPGHPVPFKSNPQKSPQLVTSAGHPSAPSQASLCGRGEKATTNGPLLGTERRRSGKRFAIGLGRVVPARCMHRTLNASSVTALAIRKTAVPTKCWWKHRCMRRGRAGAWT